MFGSFLDKLDNWVGRNFIVGSYLPFLVFATANVSMAQVFFPDQLKLVFRRVQISDIGPLDATFAFLAISAILAYVTGPLVDLMSNMLRGRYWPLSARMKRWLVAEQGARDDELAGEVRRTADASLESNRQDELTKRLKVARQVGETLGAATAVDAINAAKASIEPLRLKRARREGVPASEVDSAVKAMEAALRANCWNHAKLVRLGLDDDDAVKVEVENSDRLFRLYTDTINLIAYANEHAEIEYTAALNRRQIEFSRSDVYPTKFGNRYAALMYYFDSRFNIDLDFFLPVLKSVVQPDKDAADFLAKAQQQVEFAIRTFVFILVFTATWLALTAIHPGSYLVVPIVGSLGFVGLLSALAIIHASFASFGDAVRALCILKRFEILKALHMPLPANWGEEKSTWKIINYQLQWGRPFEPDYDKALGYQHPGSDK
jgi:hypothetical protein